MKIIYSDKQALHSPMQEWNFGRNIPYPERKQRVDLILKGLRKHGLSKLIISPKEYPPSNILKIHDREMYNHIKTCGEMSENEAVYAHIFPYRGYTFGHNPKINLKRAGYFCFDVGTQITKHTYAAAKSAADCALTGADLLMFEKENIVFTLSRPPGHHADRNMYGGYCYFNNAAIAAMSLLRKGRVMIVDLDFHHGNGTQSIFYDVPNVYFISIHGDPAHHYPYFCGFRTERGNYLGAGTNLNIPLTSGTTDDEYRVHLQRILRVIKRWKPSYIILSMGFDTFEGDPLGDFKLSPSFYTEIGATFAKTNIPILACLEGGYAIKEVGTLAANFCNGLMQSKTISLSGG